MSRKFLKSHLFLFVLAYYYQNVYAAEVETSVPLKTSSWVILNYSKISSNRVIFEKDVLTVKVRHSAGPIVHKLEKPIKVLEFFVKGKLTGVKNIETNSFDQDSVLRFGLVAIGQQTLSGPKKWFAADWVKKLFALAPDGLGIDKIYFFNLSNREELVGKSRIHPKSELIVENISAKINKEGMFDFKEKIEPPIEAVAIWISIDGDDSQSEYETSIFEIRLKVKGNE